jgi:hypothetical protein
MPRPNLIGASNRYTNSTCVFGSMAGLAPTATVRSDITRINGYKYLKSSNDAELLKKGCGFNKSCANGNQCIKAIGYSHNVVQYRTGGGQKLLA